MENQSRKLRVAFVGNDLMFQSRISSVCKNANLDFLAIRDPANMQNLLATPPSTDSQEKSYRDDEAKSSFGDVRLVIVDLGTPKLDVGNLLSAVRAAAPHAKLIGYGPHVQADLLEQAESIGFDAVLTRGLFDRSMQQIISSL